MGEYVYAFSGAGVSVTSFADMNTTSTLELPGFEPAEPYYYEDIVMTGDGEDGESEGESSSSSEGSPPKDDD
jgi:hypothetical protein